MKFKKAKNLPCYNEKYRCRLYTNGKKAGLAEGGGTMKAGKWMAGLLMLLLFFCAPAPRAAAAGDSGILWEPAQTEVLRESQWRVRLSFADFLRQQEMVAFRFRLAYDADFLTLRQIAPGIQNTSQFTYKMGSDGAEGIYSRANTSQPAGNVTLDLVFDVNEGAPPGSTDLYLEICDMVDKNAKIIPGLQTTKETVSIIQEQAPEAFLLDLIPSAGQLQPGFSSDIFTYTLQAPYESETLSFDTVANEGSTVHVNRKRLGKIGEPTAFVITVTSSDKEARTQYVVQATRQAQSEIDGGAAVSSSGQEEGTVSGGVVSSQKESSSSSKNNTTGRTSGSGSTSRSSRASSSSSNKSSPVSSRASAGEDTETAAHEPSSQLYLERHVYMQGNQMPVYVVGILCGVICILLIVVIFLWWNRKPTKASGKKDDTQDKQEKESLDGSDQGDKPKKK